MCWQVGSTPDLGIDLHRRTQPTAGWIWWRTRHPAREIGFFWVPERLGRLSPLGRFSGRVRRATQNAQRIRPERIFAAKVLELRRGPPKTSKLPQSIQSPEGVDLIPSRDGRIELRAPSAPSARLAEIVRIHRGHGDARLEPTVLSSAFGGRRVLASRARWIRPPRLRLRETRRGPAGRLPRSPSRDGRIRTGDPLNPIQVRYRAAPRPVREGI